MLGDMSCEFQTNSCVEVDLMLQTDVTSARSSCEDEGVFGGARAPPSDHLPVRPAGPYQEEQRTAALAAVFLKALPAWLLDILFLSQSRTLDASKKNNSAKPRLSFFPCWPRSFPVEMKRRGFGPKGTICVFSFCYFVLN